RHTGATSTRSPGSSPATSAAPSPRCWPSCAPPSNPPRWSRRDRRRPPPPGGVHAPRRSQPHRRPPARDHPGADLQRHRGRRRLARLAQGERPRDRTGDPADPLGRRGRHDRREGAAHVSGFYGHVIDGEETESLDGRRMPSVDPWTREPWAEVALGGADDAARAVTAARRAFDEGPWPRMGFAERGRILHRLADLVEEHRTELGLADTRDMGKPVAQSGHDVLRAAANLRFFADHARLSTGQALPMDSGHHAYTRYEPA